MEELLHQPEDIIAQRYSILDTLGQGGSGTTYLAEDLQSGEQVALKVLSLRHISDWKAIALFEREAQVLAQLNHPAIPRYLEYFHVDTPQDRAFYLAQQVAPGKSLAALVENGWRTNEGEVRSIAIQLLEILVYLHGLTPPVIHRDIKPQNIIRPDDGQVFLVDFGAVQDTYHTTFAKSRTVVGTFGYMAPEQFRGQAVPTTDLYGLGATLLFLLTHRSPAELPTDGLKVNFREHVPISAEFADWLEKILEPDVEERFKSAKEALAALRGKQMMSAKSPVRQTAVTQKALVGVGVGAAAVVAVVSVFNSFKYPILVSLGYKAENLCWGVLQTGYDKDFMRCLELQINVNKESIGRHYGSFDSYPIKRTMLHEAKSREIAELLIAKGADVNARDNFLDTTPLHWAVARKNKEVIELLIANGADVNAKDKVGLTPLKWVLQADSPSLKKELLADPHWLENRVLGDSDGRYSYLGLREELRREAHTYSYTNEEVIELLKGHGAKE